tara:strand:- start:19032 stop:20123 length:1092 start_codon:yes stop_codon:yes gene_type:complete
MTVWVIKIGTSLLRNTDNLTTTERIHRYCKYIAKAKDKGNKIILVTSGAVGLGCRRLGINQRPKEITSLQAAAAVGQGHLMSLYEKAMEKYGYNIAQVLLTRSELGSRDSYINASKTLKKLLEWKVLPIVNENDATSNEELKYGDNDTLSALVANAIDADQLILLTDIDRLYSTDPKKDSEAMPITDIHHPNDLQKMQNINQSNTDWGTGGIRTKLTAARIATERGITVHLSDGRDPKFLGELLEGSRGGTVFHPHPQPLGNRKSWLIHALKTVGNLYLDQGACYAIKNKGASLLLVGIEKIDGEFEANQPVRVLNNQNVEIARGISSLGSEKLRNLISTPMIKTKSPIVIHRDVLVLTNKEI